MLSESRYLKLVCYQKVLSEIIILKLKKKELLVTREKSKNIIHSRFLTD